jgi:hypothetical protein
LDGANQETNHPDVSIEYSSDSTPHIAATAHIVFFTNPHEYLCGPIECSLKTADCGADYAPDSSDPNLWIDKDTGEVTARKDVDAGYVDSVCVRCMNGNSSVITFPNWTVT